jgi:hypothetical protein
MANVAELVPRLLLTATFRRVEVLGDLSDEGMAALGDLASSRLQLIGGVVRS